METLPQTGYGLVVDRLGYELVNARICLAAAARAYTLAPTIECTETSTEVRIEETDHAVIIAFRGTQQIRDWITDLDCRRVNPWLNGDWGVDGATQVHAGFSRAIESVWIQILDLVPPSETRAVFITGHSLGGALAMLFAANLKWCGRPLHSVYTFGQPRVGNAAFAAFYDQLGKEYGLMQLRDRTFRFVNEEDIVPRVPGVLMGYRHAGLEMFLSEFGGLVASPKIAAMAISDLFGFWADWKLRHQLSLLGDHPIAQYLKKLNDL